MSDLLVIRIQSFTFPREWEGTFQRVYLAVLQFQLKNIAFIYASFKKTFHNRTKTFLTNIRHTQVCLFHKTEWKVEKDI